MNIYPRSRDYLFQNLKKIPNLIEEYQWTDIIPINIYDEFYSSFINQLHFFVSLNFLTIHEICTILGICHRTYYRIMEEEEDSYDEYNDSILYDEEESDDDDDKESEVGRPPLVNDKDEQLLLQHILECQEKGDCLSPKECRAWLQNYIYNDGRDVILNRQWWFNFKLKYNDLINVLKIQSLESKRFDVSQGQVDDYFNRLEVEVNKCPYPQIILNMDESGFISRPYKDKKKNCVIRRDCSTHPCFRDSIDGYHISVVAAVTLSGVALTPLLISTTKNPPKEIKNSSLGNKFLWYQTESGYLDTGAMVFWVQNILLPYLHCAESTIPKPVSPLLLFDNLKSHLATDVLDIFKANNIRICPLPPHSSHILQVLDLSFFGKMKEEFKNYQPTMFQKSHKMSCKIEKVLKSYFSASFPPIIMAGWKRSGFDLIYDSGIIKNYSLNRAKVISKLLKNND